MAYRSTTFEDSSFLCSRDTKEDTERKMGWFGVIVVTQCHQSEAMHSLVLFPRYSELFVERRKFSYATCIYGAPLGWPHLNFAKAFGLFAIAWRLRDGTRIAILMEHRLVTDGQTQAIAYTTLA